MVEHVTQPLPELDEQVPSLPRLLWQLLSLADRGGEAAGDEEADRVDE